MSENFTFRRYKNGDFEDYKNLYLDVYSNKIDEAFFNWKNVKNPIVNNEPIIYLIFNEDNKLIGSNSFFPGKMTYNGIEYLGVQSGDTMVTKEYRGKGLFQKVIKYAMDDLNKNGFSFIYGFANKNSHPGFVKLGFDTLCKVNTYIKILSYERVLTEKKGNIPGIRVVGRAADALISLISGSGKGDYIVEATDKFDDNTCSFINMIYNEGYYNGLVHQIKNKGFIEWKYDQKPYSKYDHITIRKDGVILAAFIVRIDESVGRKTGDIVEYFIRDRNSLVQYFKVLEKYYRKKSMNFISIWDISNNEVQNMGVKNKYIRREDEIFFIVKPLNDNLEFMSNMNIWHAVSGDSDTV